MWMFYAIGSSFLQESHRFWRNVELERQIQMWQQLCVQLWY